jgi:hypothetical protein
MRLSITVAGGMQIGEGCFSDDGASNKSILNVTFALDRLYVGPTSGATTDSSNDLADITMSDTNGVITHRWNRREASEE